MLNYVIHMLESSLLLSGELLILKIDMKQWHFENGLLEIIYRSDPLCTVCCGAVELYSLKLRAVSNILSISFISISLDHI